MNIINKYSSSYQNTNYTDKSTNNQANTFSSYESFNNTDIDKEEDAILYQELKACGCDFKKHSLEDYKKAIVSFPPLTAPGNVRKAYRQAFQNATPAEKEASRGMSLYMYIYKDQNKDNFSDTNDVNGYLDLMKNFKSYFTRYDNILDKNKFNLINSYLDKFTNELSKYTFKK
jgi:hypothetical protein